MSSGLRSTTFTTYTLRRVLSYAFKHNTYFSNLHDIILVANDTCVHCGMFYSCFVMDAPDHTIIIN